MKDLLLYFLLLQLFTGCYDNSYKITAEITVVSPNEKPISDVGVTFQEVEGISRSTTIKQTDKNGFVFLIIRGDYSEGSATKWQISAKTIGNQIALNTINFDTEPKEVLKDKIIIDEIKSFKLRLVKNSKDTGLIKLNVFLDNKKIKRVDFATLQKNITNSIDTTLIVKGLDLSNFRITAHFFRQNNTQPASTSDSFVKINTLKDSTFIVQL